jgi:hypothetical protein
MVILKKISEEDLSFLLEIRNDDTTRVNLENDTVFNLDDCKQWFLNTKPEWFIILNENQEKVGYLRTNGDEVGCDIHPNHRRKGYAKQAFLNYLKDKTYATLWVFEDNFAINLYEKLRFIRNGESKTIRERKYVRMIYTFEKQKSCYVINFWLGERRVSVSEYIKDRLFFLKKQIKSLEQLDQNIDVIIFNFNITTSHYKHIKDIFEIVPKKIKNSKIEINFRENYGMSYGAFSDVFKHNLDRFDYYIFNEDDYVFTQHNWDKYLVEKFQSLKNCGYLSMAVTDKDSIYPKHASHSTGITSYEVLKKLFDKFGELPHSKGNNYGDNEHLGQVKQTNEIYNLGYELYDLKDDFQILFLNYQGNIKFIHEQNKEIFIKPAHMI